MADQTKPVPVIGNPPASARVPGIQALLQRWTPLPPGTKSPEEDFQEKYKEAQALFDTATAATGSHLDNPASYSAKVDLVVSCGLRLKELVADHEAQKDDKQLKYEQLFFGQQEALVLELLDTLGPELGDNVCKKWRQRAHLPLNSPAGLDAPAGSSTEGAPSSSYFTPNVSPALQASRPPIPRAQNESAPILPTAEASREQTRTPSRPLVQNQLPSKAQGKRPANTPQGSLPRPPKRPRSIASQPLTDRTIKFDDVYQNGNARVKYTITLHKKSWYTLGCEEHNLHFKTTNPIKGAQKHLTSNAHGQLYLNYDETVSLLGTRVLDCNKELADLNNDVTQRPSYEDLGRPSSVLSTRSSREHPRTRRAQVIPGLDPKPGDIYTVFWPTEKKFYAVLVVPWGKFRQFGWDMELKDCSGILDKGRDIPSCYKYDRATGSVEWAENFKPGGRSHHKRKYPVLYFDSADVPGKCLVGWVGVPEFRYYNPLDTGIPFKDEVDAFIKRTEDRKLLGDVEMDAQAAGPSSGDASEQQNAGADEPLGTKMHAPIYISDCDESDDDEDETEAGPSTARQQPTKPRVKVEPTNEEAPTQPSDAATAQATTNSVVSEMANHWNGLDRPSIIPTGLRAPEAVMAPGNPPTANGQPTPARTNNRAISGNSTQLGPSGLPFPGLADYRRSGE